MCRVRSALTVLYLICAKFAVCAMFARQGGVYIYISIYMYIYIDIYTQPLGSCIEPRLPVRSLRAEAMGGGFALHPDSLSNRHCFCLCLCLSLSHTHTLSLGPRRWGEGLHCSHNHTGVVILADAQIQWPHCLGNLRYIRQGRTLNSGVP